MSFATRAVAAVSRRLDRPQWLAAVDAHTREAQREEVGIAAILAVSLRGSGSYVDVGANRGQVLREAVRVAPRGRHLAFEPIPALAQALAQAFPGVECRAKALGARGETAQFHHYTRLDGWSGMRARPEISEERGRPQRIQVEVSTLDAELGDVVPSVVKIDVEGAELGVLEGARATLREARPVVIFEHVADASSLYGASPEAPYELLSELGYEIFTATGVGPCTRTEFASNHMVVNWLAVHGPSALR
ncbi:MAG TPA: FkbM family methyltransferase [Solirubrobacteraceae bacterium]|jgi:FkbM family methyltransferase|nr:FkbM family methyltransferase [Solirubrobacteraceae bacterium]